MPRGWRGFEFAGELSLGGELRPVPGALAMGLAMQRGASAARTRANAGAAARQRRRDGVGRRPRGPRRRPPARCRARAPARRGRRLRARCARPCRSAASPPRRCPTCATSRARPSPSARSRSPRPGRRACSWSARPAPASRCWRSGSAACCRELSHEEALESAAILNVADAFVARRWGQRVAARAASHRLGRGAGRRRLAAAAGRGFARPPRRALPRRAAGVSARRARSPARAARDRPHRRLARRPAGRVPGPLPARRGDEPLPLRPARQSGEGLPLHAGCRAALPGAHQRAAARPHRPAGRGAGGRRRAARGRARRRGRAAWCASGSRPPGRSPIARQGASNARLAGDALDRHCRLDAGRVALPAGSDARGWAGRRGAFIACCGSPARSPTWPRSAEIEHGHLAEAIQYRRVLLAALSRRRGPPAQAACRRKENGQPAGCPSDPESVDRMVRPVFRKPRSRGKLLRFGKIVSRLVSLTPNHLPIVAPIGVDRGGPAGRRCWPRPARC